VDETVHGKTGVGQRFAAGGRDVGDLTRLSLSQEGANRAIVGRLRERRAVVRLFVGYRRTVRMAVAATGRVIVLDQAVQAVTADGGQCVRSERNGLQRQAGTASQSANKHDNHAEGSIPAEKAVCQRW
jgi:hypothetical protein